ncbi:MAG: hypothetical protein ABUT20_47995, partial [Bacteroidota bacterium]
MKIFSAMSFSSILISLISGFIGGLFTVIVLPYFIYIYKRKLTSKKINFNIENPLVNELYNTLSVRIENNSPVTLKEVIAFISIDFEKSDITKDPNILAYTVDTVNRQLMLSWAKIVDGKNKSS